MKDIFNRQAVNFYIQFGKPSNLIKIIKVKVK